MKYLSCLTLVLICLSCDNNSAKRQSSNQVKSKYQLLLSKFNEISIDTLKVSSSDDIENNNYSYKGKQLDSITIGLLPTALLEQYNNDPGYYACYKFRINNEKTALILRTPSTYEPSSIKLLVYDKSKDLIIDFFELADVFGDAGDYAEKSSWIYKDEDNRYKAFMWIQESHDNSVDNENDTTTQTWNYYYLFDLTKQKIDTVNKNERVLLKKFGSLINQNASR